MKLATKTLFRKYSSRFALLGAMFIALAVTQARAAELVMFEQAGCSWCEAFNREIGVTYDKTEDGLRAPLRRVDIARPLPPELSFIQVERMTPLFVLVDKGHEIGRIRGYGGPESFWMQMFMLMEKLDKTGKRDDRAQREKTLRVNG
jgi:thioredoxin-related protein